MKNSIFTRNFFFIMIVAAVSGLSNIEAQMKVQPKDNSEELKPVQEGFVPIFDGKSLKNWEGDPTYWRVENGNLVGEIIPSTVLKQNSFIIWRGDEPKNFELILEYRITQQGNSGINYRSTRIDTIPFALRGYQCDIDGPNRYTGQNYEEKKRTTLAYRGQKTIINSQKNPGEPGSLKANIKNNAWQNIKLVESLGDRDSLKNNIKINDWNKVHLVVNGNRMLHYVNGILMSDVTDEDSINSSFSGLIGVQVHVGPPMKVEYRNIQLKKL